MRNIFILLFSVFTIFSCTDALEERISDLEDWNANLIHRLAYLNEQHEADVQALADTKTALQQEIVDGDNLNAEAIVKLNNTLVENVADLQETDAQLQESVDSLAVDLENEITDVVELLEDEVAVLRTVDAILSNEVDAVQENLDNAIANVNTSISSVNSSLSNAVSVINTNLLAVQSNVASNTDDIDDLEDQVQVLDIEFNLILGGESFYHDIIKISKNSDTFVTFQKQLPDCSEFSGLLFIEDDSLENVDIHVKGFPGQDHFDITINANNYDWSESNEIFVGAVLNGPLYPNVVTECYFEDEIECGDLADVDLGLDLDVASAENELSVEMNDGSYPTIYRLTKLDIFSEDTNHKFVNTEVRIDGVLVDESKDYIHLYVGSSTPKYPNSSIQYFALADTLITIDVVVTDQCGVEHSYEETHLLNTSASNMNAGKVKRKAVI